MRMGGEKFQGILKRYKSIWKFANDFSRVVVSFKQVQKSRIVVSEFQKILESWEDLSSFEEANFGVRKNLY